MKVKDGSEVVLILAGCSAWAAVNLFKGFTTASIPLIPLFVLLGLCANSPLFPILFCCSLAGLISTALIPWVVLVSGLLACTAGRNMKIRVTGFISVIFTLWLIPVSMSIPIVVLAVTLVLINKYYIRCILLPAGFIVSAVFIGIPNSLITQPAVAGSTIAEGILTYSIPEVNTSRTEVLLPAPIEGAWAVWVAIEAGGVRDSIPMLAIRLGDDMLVLPSDTDTLCFTMVQGDTLAITLMRDFRPFNHSVIHATAGGERL